MEPTEASYLFHMNIATLFSPYSLDESILLKISEVFKYYKFDNKSGLLQFWACSPSPNSEDSVWNLILTHKRVVSTEDHEELIRYKRKYPVDTCFSVGRRTDVGNWFAGRASRTGIADHRTKHLVLSHDYRHSAEAEGMGQLVMPVFSYGPGGEKEPEGIIELVTTVPEESYVEDFEKLQNLLENVGLISKFMGKTIKVVYKLGDMVKFPLPYSAKLLDLQKEVTMRFMDLEHTNFRIEYEDTNGKPYQILGDENLRACMSDSCSRGAKFIKMYIC